MKTLPDFFPSTRLDTIIVLLLLIMLGCEQKPAASETERDEQPQDDNLLTLTERQVNTIDLSYGKLQERNISNRVSAPGTVDVPPMQKGLATAYVPGYIKNIYHMKGNRVQRGEALATLESPELLRMQQELLEVNGRLPSLQSAYSRQQQLQRDSISSTRELQQARADYLEMKARRDALAQQLHLAGADTLSILEGRLQTRLVIRAPISGEISDVNVSVGQRVLSETPLFSLVNTEHLHLELRVFEENIASIVDNQPILFTVPSLDHQQRKASVYRITSLVDNQERSALVHGHMEEEAGLLPGMYVNAYIALGDRAVQSVESSAITTEGESQYLFFRVDEANGQTTFRRVKVRTGTENAGYTEIIEMAEPGMDTAQVVVNGAYYLSNALN